MVVWSLPTRSILIHSEMGLLWHFVSLDDAQSARRRQILDRYGQIAQLSALIPLLAFPIISAIRLAFRRAKAFVGTVEKEHQSPQVSRFPKHLKNPSNAWWSRLQWALDEQVVEGWGTRREWLIAGLWTVWLLVLAMKDTGDGMSIVQEYFVYFEKHILSFEGLNH